MTVNESSERSMNASSFPSGCRRCTAKNGESGIFSEDDIVSLQTAILGFLREPEPRLLGICSYSRNHRRATNAGERTWRVLVKRSLIHDNDGELEATLYHEFLHSIFGPDEGHGQTFQTHEALWPLGR